MEPGLRGGDFLLVAPCDRYLYETVYLVDFGDGECPYIAQGRPGRMVSLHHPNRKYSEHLIPLASFNAAVTAMSVAEIRVQDRAYIERVHSEMQAEPARATAPVLELA
jgi:hypothetical protein